MSLLKVNEVQNYNGSSLTLTASTVSTSAQLNTGGNVSVTGSINVSDDSTTRSNLGLGTMATQNANAVAITGGSVAAEFFPTFVGLILPFAYDTGGSPPSGFFECDGSPVSRTTYSDLFSAIGTTWGVGDGSTTFNIPDLQGAFLRGTGSHGSYTMTGGGAFAGPSVGAFETDTIVSHRHSVGFQSFYLGVVNSKSGFGYDEISLNRSSYGANTDYAGGDETRPFNAGVMYCIKY